MPPLRTKLDPDGHYARLGVEPSATQPVITAAYRAKARLLHPDVPRTGNAEAFLALKHAYDIVSNLALREDYDRKARNAMLDTIVPEVIAPEATVARPAAYHAAPAAVRQPRFSDLPAAVWIGLAAFLSLCLYQAATRLLAPAQVVSSGIRPNAATVAPLSPSAHRAVLYGPAPVRLAGTPNSYVIPAGMPTVLWRADTRNNMLIVLGQLPPFSTVQVVKLIRESAMFEVLVDDQGNGLISADHLTPGTASAARLAYCSYNAGRIPYNGELLERHGEGASRLSLENRAMQPAVVKLRGDNGAVAVAVFLGPRGRAELDRLPEGSYRAEFATGEMWSRACNLFAAGMRPRRLDAAVTLSGATQIIVASGGGEPASSEISDQAFEQN